MDELCVAIAPVHAGVLSDYERVLRQRTSLLKTARNSRVDLTTLDIWDEKLAELGGRIVAARLAAVAALLPWAATAYQDVAPGSAPFSLTYATSLDVAATDLGAIDLALAILDGLKERRTQEIERGVCLVGPHRDDLDIAIGDLPAKGYASHGESWSCALALRLGSYDLLTADGGPDADADGEPVLILDDVFAELDSGRRAALAARLVGANQVLITAAVAEDVPAALAGSVFEVADGTVTKQTVTKTSGQST